MSPGISATAIDRVLPLLAVIFLLCLASPYGHANVPMVTAQDLQDTYSLAGQWRFRSGDDQAWALPGVDDHAWSTRSVPGRWPEGGFPESNQFAWYRITLQFDLNGPGALGQLDQLAIRMGKVLSAYELYAGGKLLGGVGKMPPLSEMNYDRQKVYPIPLDAVAADGSLVLALRVWGGPNAAADAWRVGPFEGEFSLGNFRTLLLSGIMGEIPGLLFCVLFAGFGLYHLDLYRRNRQLDALLWFGLAAINIGLYGIMLTQWKYLLDWSFLSFKKIEFCAIYLFPALAIQSIWSLLERPVNKWLRAYQMSFVACSLLVVIVPGHAIHYATLGYWQLWTLPLLVCGPAIVILEARAGNDEARTLAFGLLIFVATCINDLLIDLANLQTGRLASYGFVAVMLAMAVSLANRFTRLLSALEQAVHERTAELSAANVLLAQVASVDPLTGLLNRRGFSSEVEAEIERYTRSGRAFTLVMADVDNFKQFNDECGHACGDHVLKRLAVIARQSLRDVDRVGRWGGEEFIFLLPETDVDGAAALSEKIRAAIADNLFEFAGQRHSLTMTFGIAGYRQGETLDSCAARADTALYHGKERGRNRVMIGSYKGLTLVS